MRSLPSSLLALLGLMLVGVTATANSSPSPPAANSDAELICHTDNPAECYPKTFQPTDEFQIVHQDQDIPKGLHVRLNVQTGLKEAKFNVPDEEISALAGLPTDTSMVVISQEDSDAESKPKIPRNAPSYDPAGKIKPAPQDASQTNSFHQSLAILKKGLNIDEALEMLEEISHDIYYGLKIAEDYDTVQNLFCLANTPPTSPVESSRAKLAALTISSAIQNNPTALTEIAKHWPSLKTTTCPGSSEPLGTSTFRLTSTSASDQTPSIAKARISAISGLLKDPILREHFLSTGGMDLLLDVLVTESTEDWEPAQRKAALLVLDNFLDEDMGATLGEWPGASHAQAGDKDCAESQRMAVSGDCWDWHVKRLAQRHRKTDKGHWSVELWGKLKEQRKKNASSGGGKKAARVKGEL